MPERDQRLEYWMKRLDHPINHSLSASKLIYLVDGAVLALIYFIVDKIGYTRGVFLFVSFVVLFLAVINYLHSEFIRHQNRNYHDVNNRILEILGEKTEQSPPSGHFVITRDIYRTIHQLVAFSLFLLFAFLLFYGLGCFQEITIRKHL